MLRSWNFLQHYSPFTIPKHLPIHYLSSGCQERKNTTTNDSLFCSVFHISTSAVTSAALLFKPTPVCTADHQQAYYSITLKSHSGLHGHFPLPVYLSQACLFIDESKFQLQSALSGCWCWASEPISIVSYVTSRMAILCLETVL